MSAINTTLELTAGNATITSVAIVAGLAYWTVRQSREVGMVFRDWMFGIPAEVQLALAIALWVTGQTMRSAPVWYWRWMYGGAGALPDWVLIFIACGGVLAVVAGLWLLRVTTRRWLGELPWVITGTACFIYTMLSLLY